MHSLLFHIFALILLVSAVFIVTAAHPVRAALSLVVSFLSVSALMVLLGAEYMGMTLTIVYVGAVAVLFLFAIMMLRMGHYSGWNIKIKNFAIFFVVLVIIGVSLYLMMKSIKTGNGFDSSLQEPATRNDILMIGDKLYTYYAVELQIVGLILLISMIGVVYLALGFDDEKAAKLQSNLQCRKKTQKSYIRNGHDSVILTHPKIGEGVKVDDVDNL